MNRDGKMDTAHVVVVGGGGTGGALAHDLVLRGLRVTLLERGELTSGTTGRHHGLLHSGARYAVNDPESAVECIAENRILRQIAPGSFEENGGLFVALTDEDMDYKPGFLTACAACDIPARELSPAEALPGAGPQPSPQSGGMGAGRDHGRDAAATSVLRHREDGRGRAAGLHRGHRRADGRPADHRGRDPRPGDRRRWPGGGRPGRQRHRPLVRATGRHGRCGRPRPAVPRRAAGAVGPAVRAGRQPPPPGRRRRHRRSPAGPVDCRDQRLDRGGPRRPGGPRRARRGHVPGGRQADPGGGHGHRAGRLVGGSAADRREPAASAAGGNCRAPSNASTTPSPTGWRAL